MNYITNVHTTGASGAPTVHDDGAHYTESGMRVPAAEVHACRIAREAGQWLAFATERTRMAPATLIRKALDATAFSVQRRASSFAVPSKLVGTSKHQRTLWALVRDPAAPWATLEVEATADGLLASCDGEPLGLVQSKHLGWVRPLVPFGLTVHLARVTGSDYDGYTLGANVAFGHVGSALGGLLDALGQSGDGGDLGGDGAPSGPVPPLEVSPTPEVSAGDGAAQEASPAAPEPSAGERAPSPLRLVVRPDPTPCVWAPTPTT